MFSSVLEELKNYFGRNFILGVFFPTLLFAGVTLALYVEVTEGLRLALRGWEHVPLQVQLLGILAGLIFVATVSYHLFSLQPVIWLFMQGRWPRPFPLGRFVTRLRNGRVAMYHRVWLHLEDPPEKALAEGRIAEANEVMAKQIAYFPPPNHLDDIMPTTVGNILRAAELHVYDRHGIDVQIIGPRLRPLLSPEATTALDDRKTALDFMLLMYILSQCFMVLWALMIMFFSDDRWGLLIEFTAVTWGVAQISYHSAVQNALAYGEHLKATFDLYRQDLLTKLNRPIPSNIAEERREWLALTRFFYRNLPLPESLTKAQPIDAGLPILGDTEFNTAPALDSAELVPNSSSFASPKVATDQTLLSERLARWRELHQKTDQGILSCTAAPGHLEKGRTVSVGRLQAPIDWYLILVKLQFLLVTIGCVWLLRAPSVHKGIMHFWRKIPIKKAVVLKHDIAVYQTIGPADVNPQPDVMSTLSTNIVTDASKLIGSYARESLLAGKPIHNTQIATLPKGFSKVRTVAIAVLADPTMTVGGTLKAGDPIIVLRKSAKESAGYVAEINGAVLDVKQSQGKTVMILAVPSNAYQTYSMNQAGAGLSIAYPLGPRLP